MRTFLSLVFLLSVFQPAMGSSQLFLYKISYKDKHSYIFGTVHYGMSLKDLDPKISKLHRKSKTHFYETLYNPDKVRMFLRTGKEPLNLFRSQVFQTANERREKKLTPAEQNEVVKLGVPPAIAKTMSRKDCDLVYYRKYLYQGKSLDLELLHHTFMMGKAPQALDTPKMRGQAKDLDEDSGLDFSCDVGEKILKNPRQPQEMDQYLATLYKAYKAGSSEPFTDLTEGIKFRNKAWVQQLDPFFKKQPTFVTVGAYHLHGPHGLLALLKKNGYSITRL